MNKKIRVGILGGSFNPPHSGHVHISQLAIKKLGLSQLWWVVSPQNPLKSLNIISSLDERISQCEKLTKNHPKIKIKNYEYKFFRFSKKFYTYRLLKRLSEVYKDHDFYLILGADNLSRFDKWYKFTEINNYASICVFNRLGYKISALSSKAAKIIDFDFFNEPMIDISSSQIRKKV